jgi:hypothetical protein
VAGGDIIVYQGVSLHVVFDVTDDTGAVFDLGVNGYDTAAMQARTRPSTTGTPLLDLSTAAGTITIEPSGATGQVHVDVPADQTATLTYGGVYDCLVWKSTDPTDVLMISAGRLTVLERVTAKP